MYEWNPKMASVETGDLETERDYGLVNIKPIVTNVHCSEGDSLFIRQTGFDGEIQRITIDRHELYDILFNFVSEEELMKIASKKALKNFKDKVEK